MFTITKTDVQTILGDYGIENACAAGIAGASVF